MLFGSGRGLACGGLPLRKKLKERERDGARVWDVGKLVIKRIDTHFLG